MPYDLKKALGTVSTSPQPFSIYEGPKGMTLVIPPIPMNLTGAEAICGKGKVAISGKCSKNAKNVVVLKTKAPPQKKWEDGLKKAFVAAGCASTPFEIEEDAENESAENQGQESSGGTAPRPQISPNRARGGAVSEGTAPIPQRQPQPPDTTWKSGTKPTTDTTRGVDTTRGGESESSEKQSQEGSGSTPPTRPRSGAIGEKESSESESEEVPMGRARRGAVSEGTAPIPQRQPQTPDTTWKSGTKPTTDTTRGVDTTQGVDTTRGTTPKPPTTPPTRPPSPTPGTPGSSPTRSTTPPTPPPTRPTAPSPKPPPTDEQLEEEAEEHLTLRKEMKTTLTGVLQNYTGELATVDDFIAKATLKIEEMRSNRDPGTLTIALKTVRGFVEEAESKMTETQEDWDEHTKSGSDMMKARLDNSLLPKSWSEDKKKTYARESGGAFTAYDMVQRQVHKVLADMHAKIQEIESIAEEAESLSGQDQDPQVYVDRLAELNKEAEDSAKYFKLKLTKLEGALPKHKEWSEVPTLTDAEGKRAQQTYDLEIAAQENVNSKAQQFELASKRVSKIPAALRSNSGVAAGLKKFEETAAQLSKDITAVKADQQKSIQYLETAVKKLPKS